MDRFNKTIIIILVLGCISLIAQDTIIDTVYSIPWLDGCITHCPGSGIFGVGTDSVILVGDYYSNLFWDYYYNRGFVSFDIPDIPNNYFLESAVLNIFQGLSCGNDVFGEYPIFNMQSGTIEPPCFIEHIDYGYSLDESDFFAQIIHFVGIISNSPEEDWRSIQVTEMVLDDIENDRFYNQYRFRLAIDMDYDPYMDALYFRGGDSPTEQDPYIVLIYEHEDNIDDDYYLNNLLEFSNHPNPFNQKTNISFGINENYFVTLKIYNQLGQLVKSLVSDRFDTGQYTIEWDGKDKNGKEVSNGVYLCRLRVGKKLVSRKILMIK